MSVDVNNPYRSAIVSERESSQADARTLATGLDAVIFHMRSAWTGGTSDQVRARLATLASSAASASEEALQAFTDAANKQPRLVAANAWQVHWKNLVP